MPTNSINVERLETIKNESMDAYREYLKDRKVDYRIVVKRESEAARRSLERKARTLALKQI